MEPSQASITALVTAFARAYHAANIEPKIFNDYLAAGLFTPEESAFFSRSLAETVKFYDPEFADSGPDESEALARVMKTQTGPITLSRSAYTEEKLAEAVEAGVRQYIILGAGFDTFAWRRPGWAKELHVFEVDHPATQAEKRRRVAGLDAIRPDYLHFIPADFSSEGLKRCSAFDCRDRAGG